MGSVENGVLGGECGENGVLGGECGENGVLGGECGEWSTRVQAMEY